MAKTGALCAIFLALTAMAGTALAAPSAAALAFDANCAGCHPGGRNIVNPAKDLRVMTLKANGIRTAQDIVSLMRRPGPGMTRFDAKDIPDKEALEIAQYILATFR